MSNTYSLYLYKKVAEVLLNPVTDKDGSILAECSRFYFANVRRQLVELGMVRKVGEIKNNKSYAKIYQYALDNINNFESDFEERNINYVKNEDDKIRKEFNGAMAKVENLSKKLKDQSKLIRDDRNRSFHRQGAMSSGGVEFV